MHDRQSRRSLEAVVFLPDKWSATAGGSEAGVNTPRWEARNPEESSPVARPVAYLVPLPVYQPFTPVTAPRRY